MGLGFFWFWVLFVFLIWDFASYPSLPAWMRNSKWNTAQHTAGPQMSDDIKQTTIPIPSVRKHTIENVCLVIHPSFCEGEEEVKAGDSSLLHTHTHTQLASCPSSWLMLTSIKRRPTEILSTSGNYDTLPHHQLYRNRKINLSGLNKLLTVINSLDSAVKSLYLLFSCSTCCWSTRKPKGIL